MTTMHYIGFDIHKNVISFCEEKVDGEVVYQGLISDQRVTYHTGGEQRRAMDRCNGGYTVYWMDL